MGQQSFGNGVNVQPSYYGQGDVNFRWDLMKPYPKIRTIRIEISPDSANIAPVWIDEALRNGYQVICTYHKWEALGSNDTSELFAAADWWVKNYTNFCTRQVQGRTKLAHRRFVINIMNEWGNHDITPRQYVEAYNKAIGTIRGVYGGTLIIDAPGWGQEVLLAAAAIRGDDTGGLRIGDSDIMVSLHIYPGAFQKYGTPNAKGGGVTAGDLQKLRAAGADGVIGEFGSVGKNHVTNWQSVVQQAKALDWPVLGWAWNGHGPEAGTDPDAAMNMVVPNWAKDPKSRGAMLSPYFSTIYEML